MADLSGAWLRRMSPGLRFMVISAFSFSLMNLFVKLAGQRLPSAEIVLSRSVISLGLSYVLVRRAGVSIWGKRKGALLFRGLIGFAALSCFYYAIPRLPLAEATILQFTHPVFTALLAALFLRERLTRGVLASLGLSLVGVVLIARPGFLFGGSAGGLAPLPVALTLAGAVCAAVAYVTVRRLSATEHALVIVFYFPLVSVPASLPFLAGGALWPTPWEWAMLLGVGICTQVGQVYLTKGLQAEEASRASAINYVQIPFAAAWGALVFGEYPDLLTLGGALLIGGGLVLAARS